MSADNSKQNNLYLETVSTNKQQDHLKGTVSTEQSEANAMPISSWENFPPNLFGSIASKKSPPKFRPGASESANTPQSLQIQTKKRATNVTHQPQSVVIDLQKVGLRSQPGTTQQLAVQNVVLNPPIDSVKTSILQTGSGGSTQQSQLSQALSDNPNVPIVTVDIPPRKISLTGDQSCWVTDEDMMNCCEEVKDMQEQDIRRQINQKLIKNKNQFVDYVASGTRITSQDSTDQRPLIEMIKNQKENIYHREQNPQRQQYVMIMDKRSRSETPDKMSATEVLFRAHQKLQMRQKESPAKLLEKHQQRQRKAEEVRTQIENSKKKWYEKIRLRQEVARQKWKELLAERKRALYDKLEQAEERRESEIEILRNKAKQEIQKIDETNFIVKMTMNNMKLDMTMKMSETQERRNQILEENKRKIHDRHLKEEAAEKRRQDHIKEQESKINKQKQKREQAEMRRNQMLQKKKRAAEEYQKRIKVLQRKNDLDKISDVMSFVNNSEQIWEFLGNENELKEMGFSEEDDLIFELISKDQLDIQKYKLKLDADLLNRVIVVDSEGNVSARKEYLPLINKMNKIRRKQMQGHSGFNDSSDSSSSDDDYIGPSGQFGFQGNPLSNHQEHNKQVDNSSDGHIRTPNRLKQINKEEIKSQIQEICLTDNSGEKEDDSIADESALRNSEEKCAANESVHLPDLTDEAQNYNIYQLRIKMSMKRNVLKKSLSEDLTWADFLKNENYYNHGYNYIMFGGKEARSLYSTPERKVDIPSEYEKDDSQAEQESTQSQQSQPIQLSRRHHQKKGASHSSRKNSHNHSTSLQNQIHQNNNTGANQQALNQSSGNLSDKQGRISSVVYPSTKKKNPKNEKQVVPLTIAAVSELHSTITGLAAYKQKGSHTGSNCSSTQSLLLFHQNPPIVMNTSETPREGILINAGTITLSQGRKSLVLETDSGRKKTCHTARISQQSGFGSQLQDTSGSTLVPQNIFNTQLGNPNITTMMMGSAQNDEEKLHYDQNPLSHTSTQMNQLITNSKPIPSMNKTIPKKLTVNANKMLFPLPQQKLLLKRPGKDGQFGKFKINLKLEELVLNKPIPATGAPAQSSSLTQQTSNNLISAEQTKSVLAESLPKMASEVEAQNQDYESLGTAQKGDESTPIMAVRKDSTDTNNSATQNITSKEEVQAQQTPPAQQSKLLQVQQKFLEKLHGNQTLSTSQAVEQNLLKKKNTLPGQSQIPEGNMGTGQPSQLVETTPSPKKDIKGVVSKTEEQNESTPNTQQDQFKDTLIRYLLVDNIQSLKQEDTQKIISLENEESVKLIDYLELNELQIRFCRLCDSMITEGVTSEAHVQTKAHKKIRDELQIKDYEDLQLSVISIHSAPGDIEKELLREKEKALKRKVKRIKTQMISQAVSHEAAASYPNKDFISSNKKRCQILCIELEKQVIPIIKDYDALESSLKEIIKILEMRKSADLHLMRKLKFIPILIEICKRISVCHKNEFKHLGKALEYVIKIISIFCGLRENRNYMLQTNRMSALIELLNWCLNRPTQLFYGIGFIPQLFHILTLHVKHRTPFECQQMKELFVEYLISSPITMKIKSKFQIINGPLDLSEMMGQVPLFLLKCANFLESLTSLISRDAMTRPVYDKTEKIGEHVFFVIQNTDFFGIVQMITTILLTRNQPFKPSQNTQFISQKILPQTILSLAITSIKIVNNVFRMDYRFAQQMLSELEISEQQLYHLFNYILVYTTETVDKQPDSKELLHETILFIGYFCLHNEKNQALLCRGESTIIQKLCGLPIAYFHDKKMKEILFPTLIQASYKNERSLAVMDQEISIEMIVNFIKTNIKEELPKIIEEENDYQSMSSMSHSAAAMERRSRRSPSLSSTNSSQCSLQIDMTSGNSPYVPLFMRFPKKLWKDAIQFYSQVLY